MTQHISTNFPMSVIPRKKNIIIKKGGHRWLGINSKSVKIEKQVIDITSDEDDGFRVLMAHSGSKTLEIAFSGITKDLQIRNLIYSSGSTLHENISIEYPIYSSETIGAVIYGVFSFGSLKETGASPNGTINFSGVLKSSGIWNYEAGI
tara:strand:- start:46 stop:492 length:447 start_codon:yes stop_codon:yes gene_type:complete